MSVKAVKIDEISKQKPATREAINGIQHPVEHRGIARGLEHLSGAGVGEDVTNFADRDHLTAGGGGAVEQRWGRRRDRVVAVDCWSGENRLCRFQ